MKLLFDEHLSFKLVKLLSDLFPGSKHVSDVGLITADDQSIWNFSKHNDFIIVTKDSDFIDISDLFGHPPFVIWIRSGNTRVADIESLIRKFAVRIFNIIKSNEAGVLQLK